VEVDGQIRRSSWKEERPRTSPATNDRVPHISLVFREIWDTTALNLPLSKYDENMTFSSNAFSGFQLR
jgi:hypothetical protein